VKPKIAIIVGAEELSLPNARAKYRGAVEQAGGDPVLVPPPRYLASVPELLERFDGVLLPGGADVDPELYGGRSHPSVTPAPEGVDQFQMEAARAARRAGIPTFGICRGVQVMNVAFGGTLYEDIDAQHRSPAGPKLRHVQTPDFARDETTHRVEVTPGSKLSSVLGAISLDTNSLHHQALRRVAADLKPVATTHDGIVEAVEIAEHPFFIGVQWHPEELAARDEPSRALFSGFVAKASERAQRRAARAS
jgi:putative glutamine amidotransferase